MTKKNKVLIWPWALLAFGSVVGLFILSWVLIFNYIPDQSTQSTAWTVCKIFGDMPGAVNDPSTQTTAWAERGTFGDMFGAVNALFSGLAFAGVIIAIFLQRKELEFQREELELTREEFEKQTKEFKAQNDNLTIQRFENTFFKMLDLLNEIVRNVTFGKLQQGQKAFGGYKQQATSNVSYKISSKLKKITVIGQVIDNLHLEQYFRIIYTTLKFVEEAKLSYKEKKRYSNILRAQLSNDELFFLGYNCIVKDAFIPFKILLEKYTFLKHLPKDDKTLIQQEADGNTKFYHLRAFDKNARFSKKYLEEVDNKFKELDVDNFINYEEIHDIDLEWLSHKAYTAYLKSGKYLDQYSGTETNEEPARHILYDFCSSFWMRYAPKIGTSGPFIRVDLNKILSIDSKPDILKNYSKVLSSYKILCTAIPATKRQAVLDEVFSISQDYMNSYSEISHILEMKSARLGHMIENRENLSESKPEKKLIAENLKYKELLELGLDDVKCFLEDSKEKPDGWQLNETLYMLTILYIVGNYDKWGKDKLNMWD